MTDTRVYIATTKGPVLVQRLSAEEGLAEVALSAVCLDGTTTRLPITGAYTYFVRDHVRELSGVDAYRLDLGGRIDGGASWMLGAWVAHLLLAENRLAMQGDAAGTAIFATGEVAFAADAGKRAEVRSVTRVTEKVERLAERMAEERAAGRKVMLLVPCSDKEEAKAALARLAVRDSVILHAVTETAEIPKLLDSDTTLPISPAGVCPNPASRRRRGRVAVALTLCILAGAAGMGYSVWRSVERDWEELLRGGRYLDLDRALGNFVLTPVAALYRNGLRGRAPATHTPEITVWARRPADGGSCAGLRFRGGGFRDTPLTAIGHSYRIDRLRSLCGFSLKIQGGEDRGYAWLSLELAGAENAREALLPKRSVVSGMLTDGGLRLFQKLPLYLEDFWSWRVTAAWSPVHSEDMERLIEQGFEDEALRERLSDFGVSIVRARITLGEDTKRKAPTPRIEGSR